MIGRSGESGSGISELPARYNDDDDDDPCGLNKGFPSRFCVGCLVWHEISEDGKRIN